jgi:hypothetical protein
LDKEKAPECSGAFSFPVSSLTGKSELIGKWMLSGLCDLAEVWLDRALYLKGWIIPAAKAAALREKQTTATTKTKYRDLSTQPRDEAARFRSR